MKKFCIILCLCFIIPLSVNAKENYSEMSTQELIAIMGYVKDNREKRSFKRELKSRVSTMSKREKRAYDRNLKKLEGK